MKNVVCHFDKSIVHTMRINELLQKLQQRYGGNRPKQLEIDNHIFNPIMEAGAGEFPELTQYPFSCSIDITFWWDGIIIPAKAVLYPDDIILDDVMSYHLSDDGFFRTSRNIETRRAMIECIGYERFLKILGDDAIVLDTDTDAGGERKLIMVDNRMAFDNSTLQLLQVTCPSTGHQYVLRVPPHMATCHQAAAWVAGFDNPDDYHPIKES